MSCSWSSRGHARAPRRVVLALLLGAAGGCGGGGGGPDASAAPGAFREKPGGGLYFEDPHQGGRATRLTLLEIVWGRLVDVHGIDEEGEVLPEPVLRDFVINESTLSAHGDYRLETSPITQDTRLVVLRVPGAPDRGSGTFETLVRRAAQAMAVVLPRAPGATDVTPFSFVARNATLMLSFDDLLDDDEESVQELAHHVRVLTGYPPATPLEARILFDPHHGGIAAGRFHSTRVLIDLTVSETEAVDAPVPLSLNSLGLPRSERGSPAANVCLRLPTRPDPGSGQFTVLHNLVGRAIDPAGSRPFDAQSPTLDLVRAARSGNEEDPNNGFLLDFDAPRVLGTWPCEVLEAQALDARGFEWALEIVFSGVCRRTPERGDIVTVGERFVEVEEAVTSSVPGRVGLRGRALNVAPPARSELLGLATYETLFRGSLSVESACWLRFDPVSRLPGIDVAASARTTVRFSEPMDPASALPFDSILTVRGTEEAPVTSASIVVGRIQPSLDLREMTFVPSLPYAHQGESAPYHMRLQQAGGVTDLAGNALSEPLPAIGFTIDPASPRTDQGSFVMRFDTPDELPAVGLPDLRGQFTYQFTRGTIRPREVQSGSRGVDRSNPIVSVMAPFAPGVVTPLSPLGSKLQMVWRYADLGWSIRDESKYNLDVVGLSWSPARGLVTSDFFEQLEIRLAHSAKLPDEQRRAPVTGGVKYPNSGLGDAATPFANNVLVDPVSPQLVVHARSLGYRVDPRDIATTPSGMPIMPWPLERGASGFTWRDTAAIAVGGNFGAGVPLDAEVGPPLNLENVIGSYAPVGRVPTVGLPLLMEFRCYPSETGIGLNPLAISLASNVSAVPNFRAYSTGGFNTLGQRVTKNPDLEDSPTGGFNPNSRPPGKPTARQADNSLYLGQLDYVVRVSRVHTVWIDTFGDGARFADVVLEPDESARPPGTRILVDFRGAERFDDAEGRPFNALNLSAYGDPNQGSIVFHRGDPTWKRSLAELDGARFVQLRFSFENNVASGLVAELSAVGVAYRIE